ncbi:MAG TPA: RNA polymerase sigma factor [Candidatus Limnocylindrales bacterium]|nr:RNA polymerase sigma factor [Candidatus Limnocylindrales bacterium]
MVLEECRTMADGDVVTRVRGGDTGLYEILMRRYNQRLFRVIRSVVTNDAEAEDILQEAWVRGYEHLDQFEGRASFSTWVTRIAFNEALARVRKGKRWMPLENSEGEIMPEADRRQTTSVTPEAQAIRGQLAGVLQGAVDSLPPLYRSVFMLREVEQLSTSETAECLELSEEAVKTRLFRSRALLRRELQNRLGPAVAETYSFLGARCDGVVARVLERISRG